VKFAGFPPEAMTFFRGLEKNNNRDWFLPRKEIFEEKVKRPMWELVEALNAGMKEFAPNHVTDPAKAIFRFYRDTRFSKDKSPYKQQIAASFRRRGLPGEGGAGYYVAVSHKSVAVGGGVYMPSPETLQAIRARLAEDHAAFRKIMAGKTVTKLLGEMQGEQLSRVPRGFAKDHPAEDLLRYKQFLFYIEMPAEIASSAGIYKEVHQRFRAMAPFIDYLNAALAGRMKPQPLPHGRGSVGRR